jgi:hypothetical protein
LPAFRDVLETLASVFRERRDAVDLQAKGVAAALTGIAAGDPAEAGPLGPEPLAEARRQSEQSFDRRHGGFGDAPKFPHPMDLARLLRHAADSARTGPVDEVALDMALRSLHHMAEGGIHDHVGGGFFRYCVDEAWEIPHFEKMLYDNALLLPCYVEAWQITGFAPFARVAREVADWLLTEMRAPAGGFYGSLDADTAGEEGGYYLWTPAEIKAAVGEAEAAAWGARFGLAGPANFEGRWHLRAVAEEGQVAAALGLAPDALGALLTAARAGLGTHRARRQRPGRDEKVLTGWNGLTASALARAGAALDEPDLIDAAWRCLDFLHGALWREGRLYATHQAGGARFPAYVDDYAFCLAGLLDGLAARWHAGGIAFAVALAEGLLTHFEDPERGGLFFTAHDHERLPQRSRVFADDATPSGNGVAALALGRLGHLLGEPRYLAAAERIVRAAWPSILQSPAAHNACLAALAELRDPPELLILRGTGAELLRWQRHAQAAFAPHRLVFAIPWQAADAPPAFGPQRAEGATVAYLCTGTQCQAPLDDFAALCAALAPGEIPRPDPQASGGGGGDEDKI